MTSLEMIFGELGITQYLNDFIEQGFDSWDTILDITESDLDALGVKLGHRRKLQRRIANYRGLAPDASLTSPTRASIEDARIDAARPDLAAADPNSKVAPVVTKRKYRRHPKPDENAPERPPSAYVLFSNKMREDLKGQNLTFTEIAKLVGENWQNLSRAEKEPFERRANEAKEKYNRDLAEYKHTPEYRKYTEYLRDFRKRQAIQSQEKDAAKRLKLDAESTRGSSTSAPSLGPGTTTTSGAGSCSESQQGSEPPPSRQQRLGSIASLSTGTGYVDDSISSPGELVTHEEPVYARRRRLSNPQSRDLSTHSTGPRAGWPDWQPIHGDASSHTALPWLNPRGATTQTTQSPEAIAGGIPIGLNRNSSSDVSRSLRTSRTSASTSGSISLSHPPSLRHEQSTASTSSSSVSPYIPRTPNDASLPIHALLSSKNEEPQPLYLQGSSHRGMNGQLPQASIPRQHGPSDREGAQSSFSGSPHISNVMPGYLPGAQPSRLPQSRPLPQESSVPPYEGNSTAVPKPTAHAGENGLDGIDALLRAREIVDRRS
ncbi:hypothetical protein F5Y17DRAFT_279274 [Xylariaceae sp. FL0594]|nr:hypothetical protein F5Y17DRAFT_279274 [Xylariaceae sp. FL0594]